MRDIEEVLKVGRENQRVLGLAKAWCAHIRPDRSMMGVGLLEQQTGLPISGGTFFCDHAKIRAMQGMRLDGIALEFYAHNCRGCDHRIPVGPLLEHLGSWADAHLKNREEQALAGAMESQRLAREAEAAREARHNARILRLKGINAQIDSLVDLVNQIDAEPKDLAAGRDLLTLARLAPEVFSGGVAAELCDSARAIHSADILDALVVSKGPIKPLDDETLTLVCLAVCDRWSGPVAESYMAAHASAADLSAHPALLKSAIWNATVDETAGLLEHPSPRPDLLLKLFEVAPEAVHLGLLEWLARPEPWPASQAARASCFIIPGHPETATRLLDPLLRVLMRPGRGEELYAGRPKPVLNATRALSIALLHDTQAVDKALRKCWAISNADERQALLGVYKRSIGHGGEDPCPAKAVALAAGLAIETMLSGAQDNLMREAGVLLQATCERQPADVSTDTLLGAISVLGGRLDELNSILNRPPRGEELQREAEKQATSSCLYYTIAATAAVVRRSVAAFWEPCYSVFLGADSRSHTRVALLELVGRVGSNLKDMASALPMLFTGLFGTDQLQRARAIESIGEMDWSQVNVAPEAIVQGVLAALQDRYLVVLSAVCRAVAAIPLSPAEKLKAIQHLLRIAGALSPQRDTCEIAGSALKSIMQLAVGTKYAPAVSELCLDIIGQMPPYNAVEALCRHYELRKVAAWPGTAVRALRREPDPNYADIGEEMRYRLLRDIGKLPADVVSVHADAISKLSAGEKVWWALAVADVLSRAGMHGMAALIGREAAQTIKDTTENRFRRLMALEAVAAFVVEEKLAAGDVEGAAACLAEWKTLEQTEIAVKSETSLAQRPFFPPLFSRAKPDCYTGAPGQLAGGPAGTGICH